MNEAQVKHMVNRFLAWRLPDNFAPDAGISFKRTYNEHTPWPGKHEPIGTNLLDAAQAAAMVRHLIEGLPRPGECCCCCRKCCPDTEACGYLNTSAPQGSEKPEGTE